MKDHIEVAAARAVRFVPPLTRGVLKRPTPNVVYNAMRYELLRQHYRPQQRPWFDCDDPIDR